MRIAICDDCQDDIDYLKMLILDIEATPEDAEFYEFLSGEALLSNFFKFDLIFLDIKMDGLSGTRTAESIRFRDSTVPIVFYTGYDVGASKVVKIRPHEYLMKGNSTEEHRSILYKVFLEICAEKELPNLYVTYNGKTFVLKLSDILYISILDKGTAIWLTDKTRLEIFGEMKKNQTLLDYTIKSGVKLDVYYQQLKEHGFMYAKKSYIINAEFVVSRYKDSVLLRGGYELAVSRSKKKQFDDLLMEYWRKQMLRGK